MNTLEMITMIRGMTDGKELALLGEAVSEQKKFLARINARQLKKGDEITFTTNIRPSYLAGLPAKVTQVNGASVFVDCPKDARYGRFSGLTSVRLPMTLIDFDGRKNLMKVED